MIRSIVRRYPRCRLMMDCPGISSIASPTLMTMPTLPAIAWSIPAGAEESPDVDHLFGIELRNRREASLPRESHQRIEALGRILAGAPGHQPVRAVLEDVDLVAAGEHQQHVGQHARTGSELDDERPQEAVIEPVEAVLPC